MFASKLVLPNGLLVFMLRSTFSLSSIANALGVLCGYLILCMIVIDAKQESTDKQVNQGLRSLQSSFAAVMHLHMQLK